MNLHPLFFLMLLPLVACTSKPKPEESNKVANYLQALFRSEASEEMVSAGPLLNPEGKTIETRIAPPAGFARPSVPRASIAHYLRSMPTLADGAQVYLFNGKKKNRQDVHAAVLDVEVGSKDLQQCADAVMRFRAEFLFQRKKYADIHFNFTNGDRVPYLRYAQGERPKVKGNKVVWTQSAAKDFSYKTFRQYMELVFMYAGSASLANELEEVPSLQDIKPGDVFIQGGFPGHAVMVMDVAINTTTGKKVFLLSQSYMPAQQIHILKNFQNPSLSPWYSTQAPGQVYTPEWTFHKTDLKRFKSW